MPSSPPRTVLTPFSLLLGEDGELYSGTSYNFLGSEPIISRNSSHSPLRTEYAIPWLNGKQQVPQGVCPLGSRLAGTALRAIFLEPSSGSASCGPRALTTGAGALWACSGCTASLQGFHGRPRSTVRLRKATSSPPGHAAAFMERALRELRPVTSPGMGSCHLRRHVSTSPSWSRWLEATHEAFLVGAGQQAWALKPPGLSAGFVAAGGLRDGGSSSVRGSRAAGALGPGPAGRSLSEARAV